MFVVWEVKGMEGIIRAQRRREGKRTRGYLLSFVPELWTVKILQNLQNWVNIMLGMGLRPIEGVRSGKCTLGGTKCESVKVSYKR